MSAKKSSAIEANIPTEAEAIAVQFWIPGPPVGKQRARVVNGHAYTPKKTVDYEKHIKRCGAIAALKSQSRLNRAEWVRLIITINFGLDKRRPDCDNVLKSVMDGLQGVFWATDKNVVPSVRAVWLNCLRPGIAVEIREYIPLDANG